MSGVSPDGVAENGTRSGKVSFDLLFMNLNFTNLPSCPPQADSNPRRGPSLVEGLVPSSQHYYEGSDSSACANDGQRPTMSARR